MPNDYDLGTIHNLDLNFIQMEAEEILRSAPVSYIRDAKLRGTLFEEEMEITERDDDGSICSVDTQFFLDHTEPLRALQDIRGRMKWPLGELGEGREFLFLIAMERTKRVSSE